MNNPIFCKFINSRAFILKKMEKKTRLSEGELLKLLADRSTLSKSDIAKELRIKATTLSKTFKFQKLSPKIKHEAARLFKIHIGYFSGEGAPDVEIPSVSEPPPPEYQTGSKWQELAAEEVRLREEIARLKGEALVTAKQLREKDEMIGRLLGIIERQQKKI